MSDPSAPDKDDNICGSCPQVDKCREVWSKPNQGPFSPAGLSLCSAAGFLLPIMTAIIAGAIAHSYFSTGNKTSLWELVAAGLGLITGAAVAWLIVPIIKKRFPANNHSIDL